MIKLEITDDGVGLKNNPEKLNHYGLAIIQERSRHLNGKLTVRSTVDGIKGTQIQMSFSPSYLNDSENSKLIARS